MRCRVSSQEELWVAGGGRSHQGITVRGEFCNRLAETMWVVRPLIDSKVEVVSSNGGRDCRSALLYGFDSRCRGTVLKHNSQIGESAVEVEERREESLLRVKHCRCWSGWGLSMEVENQVVLLHGCKYRIVLLVGHHTSARVGGDALRVGFDTCNDARGGSLCYDFGSDLRGQVESDEVFGDWINRSEPVMVCECLFHGRDRRDKIRLSRKSCQQMP